MGKVRPSGHRVQRPRKSDHKSKLHQESERARPSERLRQEGKKRSAQGQTRAERSAVKTEKAKLRMGAAQEKLAAQAPAKPPGPVKRGAGALGWSVHGFVHGKVYEVEHENVGTEGAHHSELVGEAVGRWGTRRVRQAVRDHPAKAAARAESRYVKATAEHRFQTELEKHPDLGKNALIRQSVLFDNGRGFALGEHPREGFVTWQFTQEGSRRDYYWGHYYDDGAAAEKDYADRAADYQRRFHVREVKAPISRQMEEAGRLAQERQAPPAPKREAPDRGER